MTTANDSIVRLSPDDVDKKWEEFVSRYFLEDVDAEWQQFLADRPVRRAPRGRKTVSLFGELLDEPLTDNPVVISWGQGVESSALFALGLDDPGILGARSLKDLIVITAVVGNESDETHAWATEVMLPFFREHGIRLIQVARVGRREKQGVVVLDDSRSPEKLFRRGPHTLEEELDAAGTVPNIGFGRKCSQKFKGFVLDVVRAYILGNAAYTHLLGFHCGEKNRKDKDTRSYTSAGKDPNRIALFPLIDEGIDREGCQALLQATFGRRAPKSACTFCPFSGTRALGRENLVRRWRANPQEAMRTLKLDLVSRTLNSRMALYGDAPNEKAVREGKGTAYAIAEAGGLHDLLDEFHAWLDQTEHVLVRIRRVDPHGNGYRRSLRKERTGTREEMTLALKALALEEGGAYQEARGARWAQIVHRTDDESGRGPEMLLAVVPAGVQDKQLDKFDEWWDERTPCCEINDDMAA